MANIKILRNFRKYNICIYFIVHVKNIWYTSKERRCGMDSGTALEKKYQKIVEVFGNQTNFYVDEVWQIFPEMKKSTLYWNLSKLVEKGYIKRLRNGMYAFNEWRGKKAVSLSRPTEYVKEFLDETGFDYYISGLDILAKYMQHVPEQYPVIVFIEKGAKEEIYENLTLKGIEVIEPTQIKKRYENAIFSGNNSIQVVLYLTENFSYNEDGLATTEKAFIDLYFAVSRNDYPLSLQELVRIYQNLCRLGNIDKKKMITVATKRNIQCDIRFIVESGFITEQAIEFVEILRREG